MTEMRILTVRQPWAWAIIHGGKHVENRVRNIAGSYRGPVAIHAGLRYDTAWSSRPLDDAMQESGARLRHGGLPWRAGEGHILGVVDLVDVHQLDSAACYDDTEWAEDGMYHLVLANPRPLTSPIPYRGALGLRRLDEETTAAVWSQIGENDD